MRRQAPTPPGLGALAGGPRQNPGPKPKRPRTSKDARAALEKFFTRKRQEELLEALWKAGVLEGNPTVLNNLALQAFGRPREASETVVEHPLIGLLGDLRDALKEVGEPEQAVTEEEALGRLGKRLKRADAETSLPH